MDPSTCRTDATDPPPLTPAALAATTAPERIRGTYCWSDSGTRDRQLSGEPPELLPSYRLVLAVS